MQKENFAVIKQRRHAELDSASHIVSNSKSGEIPNHYNQTPDKNIPGRGPAVKTAVWNDASFSNGKSGRYRVKPGMTLDFMGFTLIELLVVVLIIGILAAIALPQYQKAVAKSRMMSWLPYVKAVQDAQERYYLANGHYTDDVTELDVAVKCPTSLCYISSNKAEVVYPGTGALSLIGRFNFYQNESRRGKIYCWASKTNTNATAVCKSIGPLIDGGDGWNSFVN